MASATQLTPDLMVSYHDNTTIRVVHKLLPINMYLGCARISQTNPA
jgi:hypothetical protein